MLVRHIDVIELPKNKSTRNYQVGLAFDCNRDFKQIFGSNLAIKAGPSPIFKEIWQFLAIPKVQSG